MNEYAETFAAQRNFYDSGATLKIDFRIAQLQKLLAAIKQHEQALYAAIATDLNKTAFETFETELSMAYKDIEYFIKKLPTLAKPKKLKTNQLNFPAKTWLRAHPYGQAYIVSPWNYPFQLTLVPLAACIAAGNTAIIKPSELSPNCSAVMTQLLNHVFAHEYIKSFEGDAETSNAILKNHFDKVFFTGSTAVGAMVATACAAYLPSISLELGGKSPCIVLKSANIKEAAKKIIWGKLLNSGQSCVAPDYILVQAEVKAELMEAMQQEARTRYGEHTHQNADLPKIINERHYQRIKNLIPQKGVVFGGEFDDDSHKIDFTLIDEVSVDDAIMQSEIFGPLMPVMAFNSLDEVLPIVRQHKNPLALYVFSEDKNQQEFLTANINFGGCTINDTMVHASNANAPFGGVGASGTGAYHGKAGFDDFSHYKPILRKSSLPIFDAPIRYVPYTEKKFKALKKIMAMLS